MGVTLIVVAVLFGWVVLLLAVPVAVAFRVTGIETFTARITIGWLFGLVRFRIRLPRAERPKPATPEPEAAIAHAPPATRRARRNVFAALRHASFRRRLHRFVKRLLPAFHARELYLRARLGLGDPAETGRLWAFAGPLNALAQNLPWAEVHLEPEFVEPVVEFETHGRLRLIPLQFIALALGFALSPASIRAWRTLRGSDV